MPVTKPDSEIDSDPRMKKWRNEMIASEAFISAVDKEENKLGQRLPERYGYSDLLKLFDLTHGPDDTPDIHLKRIVEASAFLKLCYRNEFLDDCVCRGVEPEALEEFGYIMPPGDIERVYMWAITFVCGCSRQDVKNLYALGVVETLEWLSSTSSESAPDYLYETLSHETPAQLDASASPMNAADSAEAVSEAQPSGNTSISRKLLNSLKPAAFASSVCAALGISSMSATFRISDLLNEKKYPDDKLLGLFYPGGDLREWVKDLTQADQAIGLRKHLRVLQKSGQRKITY
ncbi:MAG: hypothetical protein LBV80_10615 [Deltaproteobacteria bacterium]|jgi:hypothetical protein|nr:hypothetical protein [Deltaproteobacteria bacterium]